MSVVVHRNGVAETKDEQRLFFIAFSKWEHLQGRIISFITQLLSEFALANY